MTMTETRLRPRSLLERWLDELDVIAKRLGDESFNAGRWEPLSAELIVDRNHPWAGRVAIVTLPEWGWIPLYDAGFSFETDEISIAERGGRIAVIQRNGMEFVELERQLAAVERNIERLLEEGA